MNRILLLLILTVLLSISMAFGASSRVRYTINDNWEFAASADGKWDRINIPHTWNTTDPFDDAPGYRRGIGLYRRALDLGDDLKGKRIFLYFEGANQVAEVKVNGKLAGSHIGGYSAFTFDVTDLVKIGDANLVEVSVDNSFNENIPPLTADFNFYGGIYRDVWLVATDDVHFTVTDHASPGVFITTPKVSEGSATVNVRGTVVNSSGKDRKLTIVNSVIAADGREVSTFSTPLEIKSNSEATFEQPSKAIANPRLWSPDDPYLYRVKSVIRDGDTVLDEIYNPLGFRWFRFDPAKGFFLNGKHLKLRGTNRHQDFAGMGNALPDSYHVRDLEIIKDAGFNFLRLAHYPQDPAVLEAADRLGLLLWEETPLVNYITISPEFNKNSAVMVREMIRQHRNHPSVLMWGYMNEIFLRLPKENEENIKKETVLLARELDRIAREEDPTRPTTIAFHGSELYNTMGLGEIPQIIGWNLYNGWYSREFADFGKFLDEQHKKYPNRVLIISEYGANSDLRLHSNEPQRFDSTTEYQRMFHESYLAQMDARPYIAATAVWNQFDFGAENRGENMPKVNNKGLLTYDRKSKDVYFFYKANLSAQPVVHIASGDWQRRASTDRRPQKIEVYSNLAEVEVFNNGVSLGKKPIRELRKADWNVPMTDGENVLTATGMKNGKPVSDSRSVHFTYVSVNSSEIAVNVGSNAQFLDASGTIWLADRPYTQGGWGFLGSNAKPRFTARTDKNVLNTTDDPLYQIMSEGLSGYRFDVPDGQYEVELRFAETEFDKPDQRVFDVRIDGRTVLNALDLAKSPGNSVAMSRRFTTVSRGGLLIEFSPRIGNAILSAVRIRRL